MASEHRCGHNPFELAPLGRCRHGLDPLVLHGGLPVTEQCAAHQRLADDEPLLVMATDRYVGEGFDCPRLDTLFLAFPISAPHGSRNT